ncbi:MAG: ABC transporter ATP-binding protein, partial [Comamonas sp.]|nr:ABC transporter ATP-binding protein [Comamonas sp.]
DIGRVIRMLAKEHGMAVLLCEQYYDFAQELADEYVVMERGEVIAAGPGAEMQDKGIQKLVAI